MSIAIICPGCHARFNVDDKFAGRQGPCPKCKAPISIPKKGEEVVIHAPEPASKNAAGVSVLKPLKRADTRISIPVLVGGIAGTVLILGLAAAARFVAPRVDGQVQISTAILAAVAVVVAPPLVLMIYSFLRDDELAPHRGTTLVVRVAICSVVYAALWGLRWYLGVQLDWTGPLELYQALVLIPAMLIPGLVAALATLELDATNAGLHCAGYLGITVLLRVIAGLPPL
jgi:hypothetical protein